MDDNKYIFMTRDELMEYTRQMLGEMPPYQAGVNLLINPDFKINQRGISGAFSETGKYFVDRWKLVSGTVTVNSDGTVTLNGSICQPLENAAGSDVTASVSAGTAVYDDSTKTFTVTGSGDVISWAKLEHGSMATAFVPPDPADEMLKCMRYYEVIMAADCDRGIPATLLPISFRVESDIPFKVPKRSVPSLASEMLRVVGSTSTGHFVVWSAAIQPYISDIYGINITTTDPVITELPSYLFGVTLDTAGGHTALAVDAEIY
ncbi:MAG: hypothetical protein ACI4KF_02275 [Huintestinicola sp.]